MKRLLLLFLLISIVSIFLVSCEKEITDNVPTVIEVPSTTAPTITEKSVETTTPPSEAPQDYNDLQTSDDTFDAIDGSLNYIK